MLMELFIFVWKSRCDITHIANYHLLTVANKLTGRLVKSRVWILMLNKLTTTIILNGRNLHVCFNWIRFSDCILELLTILICFLVFLNTFGS